MKLLRYIVTFILFLAVLTFTLWMSRSDVRWFLDIPSLALILLWAFILGLSRFSAADMGRAFRAAWSGAPVSRKERERAVVYFRFLGRSLLCGGAAGTLIGIISMFSSLDDPARTGMWLSVALITTLYAMILAGGVVWPALASLEQALTESE